MIAKPRISPCIQQNIDNFGLLSFNSQHQRGMTRIISGIDICPCLYQGGSIFSFAD